MKLESLIDTRKRMPLCEQFAEAVKILFVNEVIDYGYIFDSVETISEQLSLEKSIIEKGFEQLLNEGYVKYINHSYHFQPIKISMSFKDDLLNFSNIIEANGYQPDLELIFEKEVIKFPENTQSLLKEYKKMSHLRVLYRTHHVPLCVIDYYVPLQASLKNKKPNIGIDLLVNLFNDQNSLSHMKQSFHVVHPKKDILEHLKQPQNISSFQVIIHGFDKEDRLSIYGVAHLSISHSFHAKEVLHR